jgi:GT2 family glycosyltransferase
MKHLSEGVLEETRCSPSTRAISSPVYCPVSVVVPVHNGGENFRHCLTSLTAAVPPPEEIIVVADGDTDGSWQLAEEFGAQVLRIPSPGGPARARNLGARTARGDILFFVDADVTIPPDALRQVVEAFAREPGLAAVFGSYDDTPAATNFLSQYKNLFHHYIHQTACEEASTFWGACGAIRREVFLALGGFDEQYRYPSIEDIELGFRLKRASGKILLCKALQVKHLKRWGVASLLKADVFHRALPWTELIMRERSLLNDLNLRLSSRVSIGLIYGLLLTVLGSWWWPRLLVIAGLMALSLLLLNAQVYSFFRRKRGLRFTVQVVPWHWLYYFYSGLAFAIGSASFLLRRGSLVKTSALTISEEQPPPGRSAE